MQNGPPMHFFRPASAKIHHVRQTPSLQPDSIVVYCGCTNMVIVVIIRRASIVITLLVCPNMVLGAVATLRSVLIHTKPGHQSLPFLLEVEGVGSGYHDAVHPKQHDGPVPN